MPDGVRALAFYLPQFHPVPENDAWWGAGFTEWTNTARARRLFPGHRQPDLPGELGFYDLRLPEARAAQADLARAHGVHGFVYWHYWFGGGRRILERPAAEVVASGEPDFPFCFAWANQTWTGVWHGAADRVLLEQTYPGEADERAHFASLLPAFRDARYVTVDGRPVFYVFRPEQLPDPAGFVARWRGFAAEAGLPGLYLVAEVSDLLGRGAVYDAVVADGWDAGVYLRLPARVTPTTTAWMRARRKARLPEIYPYETAPTALPAGMDPDRHWVGVYPNWDNTPRAGRRGLVLQGSTPSRFGAHVRAAVDRVAGRAGTERLVWVKSWNEWAEGNHLEPDLRWGRGWLEALRDEVR